jgi:hypothetical protein
MEKEVIAKYDRVTIDLEQDRPEMRLGAPDPFTVIVASQPVQLDADLKRQSGATLGR